MRTKLPPLNLRSRIGKWADEYIALNQSRWSPNTCLSVSTELRRFALFVGGNDLTPRVIHEYQSEQYARKCETATLFRAMEWPQRFLEWAEDMGYVAHNRLSKILKKPLKPLKPVKTFTHEQYEGLKELARGTEMYYAIVMGYQIGARFSDVALMKWANVDLDNLIIKYVPFKSRNTGREAACPFDANGDLHRLLVVMDAFKPNLVLVPWSVYICPELARRYPLDGKYGADAELRTRFTKLAEKVGAKGLTFHDLRHSFISRLVRSGASYPIGAQLTGLSSPQVFSRYAEPDIGALRLAVENMRKQDEPPEEGTIIKLPGAA